MIVGYIDYGLVPHMGDNSYLTICWDSNGKMRTEGSKRPRHTLTRYVNNKFRERSNPLNVKLFYRRGNNVQK